MSSTANSDLQAIFQFVKDAEGKFDHDLCDVKESSLGGVGVFAKRDIPAGTTLLQLHKNSIFSASNSSIANLLNDEQIDGILALNIAFIYETTVFKEKSHWYPYLKSIRIEDPQDNGKLKLPPAYWNETDKGLLRGTTLDTLFDALTPQEEVERGFEIAIDLAEKWNEEFGLEIPKGYLDITDIEDSEAIKSRFHKFVAVAYAISARVFEIDAFHESALVPVADLFNHHVVQPDLKFISLFDVCDLCGEPGMCKHMLAEEIEEVKEVEKQENENKISKKKQNKSVVQTLDKAVLEKLEADLQKEIQEQIDEKEEELSKGKELDPDECIDMTTVRDVKAGDEIFNSYGELSNVFLLTRYGFTIPRNPYDVVHFGSKLLELARNNEDIKNRAVWWSETGYDKYINWFKEQFPEEHEHVHSDSCDHDHDDEDDHEHENNDSDEEENMNDQQDEDEDMEESEEEKEEDKPWLSELEIDYQGEPNPSLLAACNLFSMEPEEFTNFSKEAEDDHGNMERLLALDNGATNSFIEKIIIESQNRLQDTLNTNASDEINDEQKACTKDLVNAELEILRKALLSLQK